MKTISKLAAVLLMIGMISIAAAATAFAASSEAEPIECTWYDLHIDATGLLSWKMELPDELPEGHDDLVVQKYTIYLDIMTNGIWRENYKTFVSVENQKEIYYGLVGIYKFRVKATFVGGLVSNMSQDSNYCNVTDDYINQGGTPGTSSGGPGTTGSGTSGTQVGPGYAGSGVPSWVEKTGLWIDNGGIWYYSNNGQIYKNKWACIYNPYAKTGQRSYDWFCFDENGLMRTGWYTDNNGLTFYLNPVSDGSRGKMVTGWQTIDGATYYFQEKEGTGYMGAMVRNATVNGRTLDSAGRLVR